jgi:enoyl-CoA hydratase
MDGIVMGGGAGISVHGSHRIVTERSMVAMPECAIGLVPDVGCTFHLSRAPGHLGEFLAITGWRMDAADAIHAGFADKKIASEKQSDLKDRLEELSSPAIIADHAEQPGEGTLAQHLAAIERHFARDTALECVASLEADGSVFAQQAAKMIRRGCPLSVACAFEMVRRVRSLNSVTEALALEYRFTYRSMSDGDFIEGIRAQIIDKDRNPAWRIARLEDVTPDHIEAMLASLGQNELELAREAAA